MSWLQSRAHHVIPSAARDPSSVAPAFQIQNRLSKQRWVSHPAFLSTAGGFVAARPTNPRSPPLWSAAALPPLSQPALRRQFANSGDELSPPLPFFCPHPEQRSDEASLLDSLFSPPTKILCRAPHPASFRSVGGFVEARGPNVRCFDSTAKSKGDFHTPHLIKEEPNHCPAFAPRTCTRCSSAINSACLFPFIPTLA